MQHTGRRQLNVSLICRIKNRKTEWFVEYAADGLMLERAMGPYDTKLTMTDALKLVSAELLMANDKRLTDFLNLESASITGTVTP